jgi:hypothetical protein
MVAAKKIEVADENHMSVSKRDEELCSETACVEDVAVGLPCNGKSPILKNTVLRGTLRQTTFRN